MIKNLNKITNWWHTQTKIQKASLKLFGAGLVAIAFQLYPPQPPPVHIAIVVGATAIVLGLYWVGKQWPKSVAITIIILPALLTCYYYYINTGLSDRSSALLMAFVMLLIIRSTGNLISTNAIYWMTSINIGAIILSKTLFIDWGNIIIDEHLEIIIIIFFARGLILEHKHLAEVEKRLETEQKLRLEAELATKAEKQRRREAEARLKSEQEAAEAKEANRKAKKLLQSHRATFEHGKIISKKPKEKEMGLWLTILAIDPDTKEEDNLPIEIPYDLLNRNGTIALDKGNCVKLTGRLKSFRHPKAGNQIVIRVTRIENT